MKWFGFAMFSFVIVGCAGIDPKEVSGFDNYSVCKGYLAHQPSGTGGRVFFGVATLGMSEVLEEKKRSQLTVYRNELERRGIDNCSANGLANFECGAIHPEKDSPEFKTCVLTITNTIEARISSDVAAANARRAMATANQTAQDAKRAERKAAIKKRYDYRNY